MPYRAFPVIHFHPSITFAGKARNLPELQPIMELHSNGRLLALLANVRLRKMEGDNTLAYYYTEAITTLRSFTV
jgi:hypothetical protein